MDGLPPFSEPREAFASLDVSLSRTQILLTMAGAGKMENVKSYPLPGLGAAARLNVSKDKDRSRKDGDRAYFFFLVDVKGVPVDADVWIKGVFKWRMRDYKENSEDMRMPPKMKAPVAWLSGDGRLASFPASFTQEVSGTVTLYGAAGAARRMGPDLSALRGLAALCDVTLRAAGADFPAHKVVLAARSPVFLAMFAGGFKEASNDVVDIPVDDCPAEVFGCFVDFLYSGMLEERSVADLLGLLELSNRFLVEDGTKECVRRLQAVGGAADALPLFRAALEKPFVPEAVRVHAAGLVRRHWQAVAASADWAALAAAQPALAAAVRALIVACGEPA